MREDHFLYLDILSWLESNIDNRANWRRYIREQSQISLIAKKRVP